MQNEVYRRRSLGGVGGEVTGQMTARQVGGKRIDPQLAVRQDGVGIDRLVVGAAAAQIADVQLQVGIGGA